MSYIWRKTIKLANLSNSRANKKGVSIEVVTEAESNRGTNNTANYDQSS